MKLIGSRIEQQMREELVRSNQALQDKTHKKALIDILESANANLSNTYILDWIPEQAEDIYDILVTADEVLIIEIPRQYGDTKMIRQNISAYIKNCSKIQRLKIAVAQDLIANS